MKDKSYESQGETIDMAETADIMRLATQVLSAYLANNKVPASSLTDLIASVHKSMRSLHGETPEPGPLNSQPAVNPKRSVRDDYIICLEDGKKFKSLKRHLATHFGMTPDQYRQKWSLPADYPMVAPAYAAARSQLAKSMGLGRKPGTKLSPRKTPGRGPRKIVAA